MSTATGSVIIYFPTGVSKKCILHKMIAMHSLSHVIRVRALYRKTIDVPFT